MVVILWVEVVEWLKTLEKAQQQLQGSKVAMELCYQL